MLMTNQQAAELAEPGVGSLHDPAAFIAPQFASILVSPAPVASPIRRNQLDAALAKPLAQRIGIIPAVGDHAPGLLARTALRPGDTDLPDGSAKDLQIVRALVQVVHQPE